jgi:selenide, water dikinase
MIDLAKRRRVMERSRHLGHCICDPRRPCPCDVFTTQGICPCAGERPEPVAPSQVRLTEWVRTAGCASKIPPADLESILAQLPKVTDPAVISGLAAADDAALYRLTQDLCLVQTIDLFTPCVDDPRLFGRICAANCLSDIYAMGGQPRTALSILAFPSDTLPIELTLQMLTGAMETFAEAGVALIGGHSIKDEEPKLGFAITGLIDPAVAAALERPQPGDLLVLTKPLGTGVLAFAHQIHRVAPADLSAANESMATLNRAAAEAMIEAGATACTDITGFGLFGHLLRQVQGTQLSAEVWAGSLPALPHSMAALQAGIVPGAIERNREYVGEQLSVEFGVDEVFLHLGFDAQTSGGLLVAIPPARLQQLLEALTRRGVTGAVIGRLLPRSNERIHLLRNARDHDSAPPPPLVPATPIPAAAAAHASPPDPHRAPPPPTSDRVIESRRAFGALMRSVQAEGALSEKTRELILFTLTVHSRCAPCFAAHYRKATELGITPAELDEAAWAAIAMGGAPIRLFYEEQLAQLHSPTNPACC